MSAKRGGRSMGCVGAGMLKAVLISQCNFTAMAGEYGSLGVEGLMVLMGVYDGKAQVRGSFESANFGRSRDVAAWRGQRDEPLRPG